MKRFVALILMVVCLFICSAGALAEGQLKTTSQRMIVLSDRGDGYYFARVENVGDEAVAVEEGELNIYSADGGLLLTEDHVITHPSAFSLQPGEFVYVSVQFRKDAPQGVAPENMELTFHASDLERTVDRITCDARFDMESGADYYHYIYVTVSNTTDNMLKNKVVTVALFDEDGKICFVESHGLSDIQIHPGSTITVKVDVDQKLVDYYESNNINPVSVDAFLN